MDEKSAARIYWESLMERYPNVHGWFNIVTSILGFFFNGHFIVAAGQWLVKTAGRIGETALLFASLWVTADFVAYVFVNNLFGQKLAENVTSICMLTFSLLPEIILFSAIITTFLHWLQAFRQKRNAGAWAWAILYTIPTTIFFGMAIYTFWSLSTSQGHLEQATGSNLMMRCLAGWGYALIDLIYAGLKKFGYGVSDPTQQQVKTVDVLARLDQCADSIKSLSVASERHLQDFSVIVSEKILDLQTTVNTSALEVSVLRTELQSVDKQEELSVTDVITDPRLAEQISETVTVQFQRAMGEFRSFVTEIKSEMVTDRQALEQRFLDEPASASIDLDSILTALENGLNNRFEQVAQQLRSELRTAVERTFKTMASDATKTSSHAAIVRTPLPVREEGGINKTQFVLDLLREHKGNIANQEIRQLATERGLDIRPATFTDARKKYDSEMGFLTTVLEETVTTTGAVLNNL